jgi:nitroreductase
LGGEYYIMDSRKAQYPVLDVILNRWSPRAMSGEEISHQELMSLFEAARWAPSSFNNQPWRFIYATRTGPYWPTFYNLLAPGNQEWAHRGAVLILAISHNNFEYNNKPSRTHSLDTGAATENLALQGYSMGLVVHGLEGFDYNRARVELSIPDDYTIEAMYVVGKHGPVTVLSEKLQKREVPSNRKKVEELIFQGSFGNKPSL